MASYTGSAWVSPVAWAVPELQEQVLRDLIKQMNDIAAQDGLTVVRRVTNAREEEFGWGDTLALAIHVVMIGWTTEEGQDDGEPEAQS